MSGDVTHIALAGNTPDEDVIKSCRQLLADAEAGLVCGIAYVTILAENQVGYDLSGREIKTGYLRAAGLLEWLAQQALRRWDSRNEQG